jgi:hypothetical protein
MHQNLGVATDTSGRPGIGHSRAMAATVLPEQVTLASSELRDVQMETSAVPLSSSMVRRATRVKTTAAALVATIAVFIVGEAKPACAEVTRPVGFSTSVGYSHPGQAGLGLTGGAYGRFAPVLLAGMLDITLVGGEPNDRYRSATFDNGTTVCRDTSNGHSAEKATCGGSVNALLGAMFEFAVIPIDEIFVGGGVRTAPSTGPYILAGYTDSSP